MRNRVGQLNGQMKVESGESGTTISIRLPISVTFPVSRVSRAADALPAALPSDARLSEGENANSHCG
jgi:chemotaxis protein histidine kinase CheA